MNDKQKIINEIADEVKAKLNRFFKEWDASI